MDSEKTKTILNRTRKQTKKPIIGQPTDFQGGVLPTAEDVLRYFEWTRINMMEEVSHPQKKDIALGVCKRIEEIWKTASIPTTGTKAIVAKVLRLHKKFEEIKKSYNSEKNVASFERAKIKFQQEVLRRLFDVCCCQCPDGTLCICSLEKKVPIPERPFLKDQRTDRKMRIGSVDFQETSKMKRRVEGRIARGPTKKSMEIQMFQRQVARNSESESGSETNLSVSGSGSDYEETNQGIIRVNRKAHEAKTSTVTVPKILPRKLENFSRVLDRHAVSNRTGAELASALFQDIELVTNDNLAAVIDKSKVQRERSRTRQKIVSSTRTSDFFDGRKDQTLAIETIEGVPHRRTIKEEHVSMVEEPGSQYMAHVTPEDGTGKGIATAMLGYLRQNRISTQNFRVIGSDGTVVNTGPQSGVIRLVELELKRPLQIIVCLLHLNELPLRKLMTILDGKTSGPRAFTGPIGKAIQDCEKRPIVNFEVILTDEPEGDLSGLSTDQQYLWDICQAVSSGMCSTSLANRHPGNVSHARWLTLANRVLRLYISTDNPDKNLKELAKFIMKVYAPSWFSIKRDFLITQASQNFHKMIRRSDYLEDKLKEAVHSTLQRNAYAAHPEMLLLAMVFDPRRSVRQFAVNEIEKARESSTTVPVRAFSLPKVDFTAEDYTDLVDWEMVQVTPPPILSDFSIDQLKTLIENVPDRNTKPFNVPAHTQAVERVVKEVTEASRHVCGEERRDGFIRSRLFSRHILPQFDHKGQFLAFEAEQTE